MTEYYAHSPRNGRPRQNYVDHVLGVCARAARYATETGAHFRWDDVPQLLAMAAEFHDLGKLHPENQRILSGERKARALPKMHVDAGVAHFLRKWYEDGDEAAWYAAILVFSHHAGLPDFIEQRLRDQEAWRDAGSLVETDAILSELERIHRDIIPAADPAMSTPPPVNMQVLLRVLLSCLVDADHTNTAAHYGDYPSKEDFPLLRAKERLERLDKYVERYEREGERSRLRREHYSACRDRMIDAGIAACDSPVGSGKTTSVMAHLLAQAERRSLRRIFVILPFTNIISQSVREYRNALVLPGEDPASVVAELHHRADFADESARHLTALWRAPIIVTTAVTFFETMASCSTATLRRLHALPGSAIFMDEAHAALPAHLLPLAWKWIDIFAREWGCYWVLASGSLTKFWHIPEIAQERPKVEIPEIVPENLRRSLARYEEGRISYLHNREPRTAEELAAWVSGFPGPRLVIVNTVQSAAVIADILAEKHGDGRVEHLSTALSAEDREKTLEIIEGRLADAADDDWILVATSCVEAGMNFSFRTGFRELSSLVSLLQASGRVNREGLYSAAEMWTFRLAADPRLRSNPGIRDASAVLRDYLERGEAISPALSTQSIQDEIRLGGEEGKFRKLLNLESEGRFPMVEDDFKVIAADSCLVVVDPIAAEKVRLGNIDWRELQRKSVRIERHKLDELRVPEILPGLYEWNRKYGGFLGWMTGVIG